MELIDRQALKNKLKRWDECDPYEFVEIAFHAVDDAPTIDAVPVVRCKDCKWYFKNCDDKETRCVSEPDWYCADGERREG